VGGSVVCGTAPADDCKGYLIVRASLDVDPPFPAAAETTIAGADLSGGKTADYVMQGVPAGKKLYLIAYVAESGSPSMGDLTPGDLGSYTGAAPITLQPGANANVDLVLAYRF